MSLSTTFDILGPVMVGPSSSHTAGALRIARLAAGICPASIARVTLRLYNSFARTYRGHGTDRALIGGILGFDTDDPRIRDAYALAQERGLGVEVMCAPDNPDLHPNTVDIVMTCEDGEVVDVRGESVGGGAIRVTRINGVDVDITGNMPTLLVIHRDEPGMLAHMTRELGEAGVNIAFMSSYRTAPGQSAYAVFETDSAPAVPVVQSIAAHGSVLGVRVIEVPGVETASPVATSAYDFATAAELGALCEREGLSVGEVMRRREYDLQTPVRTDACMRRVIEAMRCEVVEPLRQPVQSLGGMIGGEAASLWKEVGADESQAGTLVSRAAAYAMATIERSASMGVIVASPTAGSSGVVPGCLLASAEAAGLSDERLADALYCAAAIGALIERWASVAGAEGGCQAEVGTASAMAAAALVELAGGTQAQAFAAASITLTNMMGLVCDPIRGLVEVPCQVRNAAGVANAFMARDLALAGVELPVRLDEVIIAMDGVGRSLPASLRETALGGLAACPSVCAGCR